MANLGILGEPDTKLYRHAQKSGRIKLEERPRQTQNNQSDS